MQNVSISCALVCIIIVSAAFLIGLFSILCHQISAMLITAVMYLWAGKYTYIFLYPLPLNGKLIHKNYTSKIVIIIKYIILFFLATFGLFTLGIMHNKHHSRKAHSQNNCYRSSALIDGMINAGGNMCQTIHFWEQLLTARIYSLGWSVNMGWIAVMLCFLTSFLWIVLSKIMRQSPLYTSSN